jgi:hypothetical protein
VILDAVFGFRDAETAVAEPSKRIFNSRCVVATSFASQNDKKKISLPDAEARCDGWRVNHLQLYEKRFENTASQAKRLRTGVSSKSVKLAHLRIDRESS